ncbi:DUF1080 domain-containing protein [Aliifodinibius sp. S!AR15-10]|uniref:FG-GAP-like repeat-containing protein n=1 Tax=Aliifodinibius sp. S!AR15-10 TaxID=2950437 RepID=UPI0028549824|nr:FG-GAP-like repeat-containing protein [Aliifodinibius sp. S!AR15-10]MDR8394086.1 DUF1080 domain-containing protein [Aliifodinibius sp. S!AR15-10]
MKSLLFSILLLLAMPAFNFAQSGENVDEPDFSQTFVPDHTFEGSSLDGWHALGKAQWEANGGILIGRSSSTNGGLLVLDQSYQDVGFRALFRCSGNCRTGVLFRLEETENGMTGIYMSLNEDDVKPYRVAIDNDGAIVSRDRLQYAGGIWYRVAPTENEEGGFSPPEGENSFPRRPDPDIDRPIERPNTELKPGEWNQIEIFMDANVIRSFLNDGSEIGGRVGSSQGDAGLNGYGPIALYVAGDGEVRFRDVMYKDIAIKVTPEEDSSPNFRVHRISDMYYSWGAAAADFNRDGDIDVVAGPYIYYGPDYVNHREIFPAITGSPSVEFPYNHLQHTYDFNGDGWPDVLSSAFSTTLYMNPKGESRRWESYNILPDVRQSEVTDLVDIDEDGTPELVYSGNGIIRYAKPDPADPTKPWKEYDVSEEDYGLAHGIGTGDVNGDGRLDILNPYGWWEQPKKIEEGKLWRYHKAELGRYGHRASGVGGTIMAVYDANGDGLNDVVTNLNAHGFGFAWYEQQRSSNGDISFVRHMISDDYSEPAAGGITFSQPHGATFADIDQDGIQDFIVGKRYWTHLENYYDPDPYSDPVVYWYKTVRDPGAPGGAKFVPELIHNRSGAGSEITASDLDKDGDMDIISSTNRGTFIFWNNYQK